MTGLTLLTAETRIDLSQEDKDLLAGKWSVVPRCAILRGSEGASGRDVQI